MQPYNTKSPTDYCPHCSVLVFNVWTWSAQNYRSMYLAVKQLVGKLWPCGWNLSPAVLHLSSLLYHHMHRCSPSKTVSRFGSSQRSGMMPHAWLHPDKHKGQHTPQKSKSSLSLIQQSPHNAASPSSHDSMQQTATDIQHEEKQQAHAKSTASLSGTQHLGSTAPPEAAASALKQQQYCMTGLQHCEAAAL